ncbi:MAG: hypothetical protein P4L16_06510 [Chlamydiales bacterium]|nr:hypothetical protein [Chlamydiales bacterium]
MSAISKAGLEHSLRYVKNQIEEAEKKLGNNPTIDVASIHREIRDADDTYSRERDAITRTYEARTYDSSERDRRFKDIYSIFRSRLEAIANSLEIRTWNLQRPLTPRTLCRQVESLATTHKQEGIRLAGRLTKLRDEYSDLQRRIRDATNRATTSSSSTTSTASSSSSSSGSTYTQQITQALQDLYTTNPDKAERLSRNFLDLL